MGYEGATGSVKDGAALLYGRTPPACRSQQSAFHLVGSLESRSMPLMVFDAVVRHATTANVLQQSGQHR